MSTLTSKILSQDDRKVAVMTYSIISALSGCKKNNYNIDEATKFHVRAATRFTQKCQILK